MKLNQRTRLMIVALVGTLGAVAWVSGNEDEGAAPVVRERGTGEPQERGEAKGNGKGKTRQNQALLDLAKLDARAFADMKIDLFGSKSWYVPPPPPPPPKPTAPPPPFTFLGRMLDDGVATVFVSNGGRNQVIRAGDVVDRVWRVDTIDANRMKLTYLPLNETKYFALGAGS